jgi:hypothetical protein
MTDNAIKNVHDIMIKWELDQISDLDDIEYALIEAFNRGAQLGAMDSNVLEEANDFFRKVDN